MSVISAKYKASEAPQMLLLSTSHVPVMFGQNSDGFLSARGANHFYSVGPKHHTKLCTNVIILGL